MVCMKANQIYRLQAAVYKEKILRMQYNDDNSLLNSFFLLLWIFCSDEFSAR